MSTWLIVRVKVRSHMQLNMDSSVAAAVQEKKSRVRAASKLTADTDNWHLVLAEPRFKMEMFS